MNLIFEKVHIHGFLSFGDAEVNLSNNGYVFVQGINENPNDGSTSNGSGKSTILESIAWTLTGETIRGTKSIVNIHTSDGCYVELWFKCDGKSYYILRSRDSKEYKTTIKINIDGEDVSGKGIKDGEKLLAQYLPDITSQLLGSVIILGQGLPQRFSNNSPAKRKELLESLSKSDFMINDLKGRVAARKLALASDIRKVEDNLLADSSKLDVLINQLTSTTTQLAQLPTPDVYEDEIKDYTTQKEAKQAQLAETQTIIDELAEKRDTLMTQLTNATSEKQTAYDNVDKKYNPTLEDLAGKVQAYKIEVNNFIKEYPEFETQILRTVTESNDSLLQQLSELSIQIDKEVEILNDIGIAGKAVDVERQQAEIDIQQEVSLLIQEEVKVLSALQADFTLLEKEIKQKESITDICPTCHRPLDGVTKPDTSSDRSNLACIERKISEVQQHIEELKQATQGKIEASRGIYAAKRDQLIQEYYNKQTDIDKLKESAVTIKFKLYCIAVHSEQEWKLKYNTSLDNKTSELQIIDAQYNQMTLELKQQSNDINMRFQLCDSQKTQLNNEIISLVTSISNAENAKQQLAWKKQTLEETLEETQKTVDSIKEKILYNTNERDTLTQHMQRISQFETLLSRDFRGYLLQNIIEYINKKAKEYASEVFGTDRIDVELNGNDIDILYDSKALESLSGGERQKVDLIIQFSIRDMLCKFLEFKSNILALDEVFDNLDNIGCQKILNLIAKKLKDIDSIYIVSHHSDLAIPYDSELVVVKNSSGISEIRG